MGTITAERQQEAAQKSQLVEMNWDPITRIVGSLGIFTKIDFGKRKVAECHSTSSIFRGYSIFMKGKDPRDAHFITSRICGICGDNHATCATYAQNMAFGVRPPALAEWIVNPGEAEVHDPYGQRRRAHAERHILRIRRTRGVVVPANPADAARNEVRVPRILTLHENAVAPENGRSAVALRHLPVFKINLRENSQAPDNSSNRVPIHVHKFSRAGRSAFRRNSSSSHFFAPLSISKTRF